jgi:cell division protein FtsZ
MDEILESDHTASDEEEKTVQTEDVGTSKDELADIVEGLSTDIQVIGCGGGGCNTVDRMMNSDFDSCEFIALNTDAQHLQEVNADNHILIGLEKTKGRGAGSEPNVGKESAEEDREKIRQLVSGQDMVFITAGMGGGTGTGAAPVVAEIAKEEGALAVAVVTMPFASEGNLRWSNATKGLDDLRQKADTVITIPNDRLLSLTPDKSLQDAFAYCDEVLYKSVQGVTNLINNSGLVNVDFSDLKTIMSNGQVAMIGMGEVQQTESNPAEKVVESALNSRMLDVSIEDADSVLVNVSGGPSMSVEDAEGVVSNLHDQVDQNARIIWGADVDEDLAGKMQALLVVTGVESDQILGSESGPPDITPPDSGIDHVL